MTRNNSTEVFSKIERLYLEKHRNLINYETKGSFLVLKQNEEKINEIIKETFRDDENLSIKAFDLDVNDEFNYNDSFFRISIIAEYGAIINIDFSSYINGIGYCFCDPEDEDYNKEHECCGIHCDWTVPALYISKTEQILSKDFQGHAKDIWNFDFSDEIKILKEKQKAEVRKQSLENKKAQVASLLEQIKELEKEVN